MNLEEQFPYRVYLNLARRQDRRFAVQGELERAGIGGVERFPSVDGKRMGSSRGFASRNYYALAVTNRMALRRAALRGAKAVLMFEDDVILHPMFQEAAAQIELPEDWEMFFFGCKHVLPPEPAGPGLVRVKKAWDWHAVAFRDTAYMKVRRALRGGESSAKAATKSTSIVGDLTAMGLIPPPLIIKYTTKPGVAFPAKYGPNGSLTNQVYQASKARIQMSHLP